MGHVVVPGGQSRPLLTIPYHTKPCKTLPYQTLQRQAGGQRASPGADSAKPTLRGERALQPALLHLRPRRRTNSVYLRPRTGVPTALPTLLHSEEYSGREGAPYAPRHPFNPGYCSHYQLGASLLPFTAHQP